MATLKVLVVAAALAVLALVGTVSGEPCGRNGECSNNRCCSKDGECGIGALYCGEDCKSGPCYADRLCGKDHGNALCPSNYCCSGDGYCGLGSRYCAPEYGCQSGSCTSDINKCYSAKEPNLPLECPNNLCCGKFNDVNECGSGPQYCANTCISGPCNRKIITDCGNGAKCLNNYCCGNANAGPGESKTCGLGDKYCCNKCESGACDTFYFYYLLGFPIPVRRCDNP